MNISDILNHPQQQQQQQQKQQKQSTTCFTSPPLSPKSSNNINTHEFSYDPRLLQVHGKPRSRFSDIEDAIICDGVAKGLTWGQISRQLPHRKRATCFNRYRTLQGIRKSRKRAAMQGNTQTTSPNMETTKNNNNNKPMTITPPSPATTVSHASAASPPWFPSTPPSASSPVTTTTSCSSSVVADPTGFQLPSPRQILLNHHDDPTTNTSECQPSLRLPPLIVPTARYPTPSHQHHFHH